jgi:putative transposase
MPDYRRYHLSGGCYFFTVNLAERRKTLLVDAVDLLRRVVRTVRSRHPFQIDAMVILPDHIHAVWTLPPNDSDFSTRWALIKAGFSRGLPRGEQTSTSRRQHGERGIWQRRYWEHAIRDENDYRRHVDYVHFNPVKHRHVTRVVEWPYSSFHGFVRRGVYPMDWAGGDDEPAAGERL